MCAGIALARSELPEEPTWDRLPLYKRGGDPEVRFFYRDRRPRLPVWRDGQLKPARWGNGRGQSRVLPRTGWTWLSTVEAGHWQGVDAIPVDIPATFALDGGVWYHVRQGIRGLLVPDERGIAVVYMICEPASHYYQIMTRSPRMPVLIEERI